MPTFTGKLAVVAGTADPHGIGSCIARRFASLSRRVVNRLRADGMPAATGDHASVAGR